MRAWFCRRLVREAIPFVEYETRGTLRAVKQAGAADTKGRTPRSPRALLTRYRAVLTFASSALLVHVASALANIALLRWVGPSDMGAWQALVLVQTYLGIVRVGVVNGLNREYPFLKGAGDEVGAAEIAATARFHCAASAAAGFAYFSVVASMGAPGSRLGTLSMAIVSAAQFYRSYLEGTLRGSSEFRWLARVNGITGVLQLVTLPLVALGGFDAMCLRFVGLELLGVVLLNVRHPALVYPRPRLAAYRRLFTTGLPLFASNYLLATSSTFGRLFVLAQGGTDSLGMFHVALTVQNALGMVPSALVLYLAPRFAQQFGKNQDARAIASRAVRSTSFLLVGLAPLAAIGWALMPSVAKHLLPLYTSAVWEMRVALLTGIFGASQIALTAFAATKSWRPMSVFIALAVLFRFAGPRLMAVWEPNVIRAAATGALAAEAALFCAAIATVGSIGRVGALKHQRASKETR